MKQATKDELILHMHLFRELVSRQFHIADDADPRIAINHLRSSGRGYIAGTYSALTNTITLSPSNASCDTLAHELAHWVQFARRGATDCSSTPVRSRNFALASEHATYQKEIEALMTRSGYRAALNSLWG